MSKERTSTQSSNDEQTNENSDVFRQEDNAKHEQFASRSETTLQDIPNEMLQYILIKAVTMEVKNMKLVKSVWKEKADLVISRLESVCSQWSSVLTTDFFRIELHQTLDGIAQETIRMEILSDSFVNFFVNSVATLKDEILMFSCPYHEDSMTSDSAAPSSYSIRVYDRNNMKDVKEVIELPLIRKGDMAACNVSNCAYVLDINAELHCATILRIVRDEERKFNIQTWVSDLRFPIFTGSLSVSDKGNLIIIQRPEELGSNSVSVYDPNGLLQHEMMLSPDIYGFTYIEGDVIQKSNGNLVLALAIGESQMVLTEIDMAGIIERQHKPSFEHFCLMSSADTSGRILIHDLEKGIELLDSELNHLDFTGPGPIGDDYEFCYGLHFNSERNEVLSTCTVDAEIGLLRILRFREE